MALPKKTDPHHVVRKWLVDVIKNCITQTRERRGVTISVHEAFTIFEAHSAEDDGNPHTISSMAQSLGVSPSTVSRTIRRLEQMQAVRLVRDGKRLFILGDQRWFEFFPEGRVEIVKSFLEAAESLNPARPQAIPILHPPPRNKERLTR